MTLGQIQLGHTCAQLYWRVSFGAHSGEAGGLLWAPPCSSALQHPREPFFTRETWSACLCGNTTNIAYPSGCTEVDLSLVCTVLMWGHFWYRIHEQVAGQESAAQGKLWESTGRLIVLNTVADNLNLSQVQWLIKLRWQDFVGQGEMDEEKC